MEATRTQPSTQPQPTMAMNPIGARANDDSAAKPSDSASWSWNPLRMRGGGNFIKDCLGCCLCCCAIEDICCCELEEVCGCCNLKNEDLERQAPPPASPSHASLASAVDPTFDKEKALLEGFKVSFERDDPEDPHNWSRAKRWYLTIFSGILAVNSTFASSAPSGILQGLTAEWPMSSEVSTLLISLFVTGYCVGPLLWAPLSEQYGRRPIFLISFLGYTGMLVGCTLAPNTGALLTFRFLAGVFASCPLANSGAVIADVWDAGTRGKAMSIYGVAPFAGPALGPIVGGYMHVAGVHWRWLFWVLTIFAGACLVLIYFTLPETYSPIILARIAAAKWAQTKDVRYCAPIEQVEATWRSQVNNIIARPFQFLFTEPMLIAITIYMSFLYGCTYLLFEAFPIVFTVGHHLDAGASGLMFLPLFLGGVFDAVITLSYTNPRYRRLIEEYSPNPVPPERRLGTALVGGPMIVVAFFWFGWTSSPKISFWAPMMSASFLGCGIVFIFLPMVNYIVDAYLRVAASALAASTVVRSLFGAGFPLFTNQMYEKLDPRWASTLLGCIALLLVPIPIVLIRLGPLLRMRSNHGLYDPAITL
ncbi:hypothetical protein BOTBODRAFT_186300 [Botryobasidium botryosum FD-172 SS1]|uniref:Major facilitator superfamily (MFS) profile domain-containing protein n=1 Tax=Botryobasidium botryosum (strain FD-172 SS1) TaxID=930990 RepID=A0A067MPI3_BOTB1|nr:hypothetical protein BOTBODRAFT_186300 [Botryobasidium botryosum FD-172 SS1]